MVPQSVLLLRRISRGRFKSNRAKLRGKVCSYAICREPAFSPLVYALYRPVDTTVHGPDRGRVHRNDPRRTLLFPYLMLGGDNEYSNTRRTGYRVNIMTPQSSRH